MSHQFECRVGGLTFLTTQETLLSVPDSFFQAALNDTWNASGANFITIERDGTHFQYILDFLRFGHLPCDYSGRCNIAKEVVEALRIEADYYGLSELVKQIDILLQFNMKRMRYVVSEFFCNSSPGSGGVRLYEFATFEGATKFYEDHKLDMINGGGVDQVVYVDNKGKRSIGSKRKVNTGDNSEDGGEDYDEGDYEGDQVVVVKEAVKRPANGITMSEVFQDGNWKRPGGCQLLIIPTADDDKGANGAALFDTYLRTYPDNRGCDW